MKNDFTFDLTRPAKEKISEQEILNELEKVACHFNYEYFRRRDFDDIANIHSATVERFYKGSWSKAIQMLEIYLQNKNIEFNGKKRTQRNTSEKDIFQEMERIWLKLGHRPSRSEWVSSEPKMSYDTVYRHFGGWINACRRFVEYKTGTEIKDEEIQSEKGHPKRLSRKKLAKRNDRSRSVSLNVRMKVLNRDNFRCVICGRSPATDLECKLHVDHIIPFSRGGDNTEDNLQTLCEKCNLGKSNDIY
ncbi:MAG: HNH endonuclease [Bacteroidales bacterium]|nr:HNH endonuclease [Bacteroidales bacterium]